VYNNPREDKLIVAEVAVVVHEATIVPNAAVGETKYWYPLICAGSSQFIAQERVGELTVTAPLAGLSNVGAGATVSNCAKNVLEILTPLALVIVT